MRKNEPYVKQRINTVIESVRYIFITANKHKSFEQPIYLKVGCLRVLGQVQGFRLTQHWFEYFIQ
jgi:hypothetical protein